LEKMIRAKAFLCKLRHTAATSADAG